MFEGFDDGPWDYGDNLPPPEPPKWWEWLIALIGLVLFWAAVFDFFYNG